VKKILSDYMRYSWIPIFLCLCGTILVSSFLGTIVTRLSQNIGADPEAPDVTRPSSISIQNMPLISKPADQPVWYLYSSAEPTRDDDDDMDTFRKLNARR